MATINPYIIFNGNCEKAFNFYKSVFGSEFQMISRFKDAPADAMPAGENEKEKIMHVALPIGKECVLMGSDSADAMGKAVVGSNVGVSVQAESDEEATKIFNGLSAGGKVTMPLARAFWNAYFGMCTDKFGINWMINHDYEGK